MDLGVRTIKGYSSDLQDWVHFSVILRTFYLKGSNSSCRAIVSAYSKLHRQSDQHQGSANECNIGDHVLLSKDGYVNHIKSREKCERDTRPLWLSETTCVICSKVFQSHSGFKRHIAVHKKPSLRTKSNHFYSHDSICLSPVSWGCRIYRQHP